MVSCLYSWIWNKWLGLSKWSDARAENVRSVFRTFGNCCKILNIEMGQFTSWSYLAEGSEPARRTLKCEMIFTWVAWDSGPSLHTDPNEQYAKFNSPEADSIGFSKQYLMISNNSEISKEIINIHKMYVHSFANNIMSLHNHFNPCNPLNYISSCGTFFCSNRILFCIDFPHSWLVSSFRSKI